MTGGTTGSSRKENIRMSNCQITLVLVVVALCIYCLALKIVDFFRTRRKSRSDIKIFGETIYGTIEGPAFGDYITVFGTENRIDITTKQCWFC